MSARNPHDWTWEAWRERVRSLLDRAEFRYDLSPGEILAATSTDDGDLQELWTFGWTPGETANSITESLGLR